jgi:hypothetical protein
MGFLSGFGEPSLLQQIIEKLRIRKGGMSALFRSFGVVVAE